MLEKNENIFSTEHVSELEPSRMTWMNTKEAAQYLRRTEAAFRAMIQKGYIRPRKFHRRLYFKRTELDRAIESAHALGNE